MNHLTMKKVLINTCVALAISTLAAGCGGGGGGGGSSSSSKSDSGSSSSSNTPVVTEDTVNDEDVSLDFVPSADRKLTEATESNELYIEQNFGFGFSKTVSLTVNALSMEGEILGDAVVSVYSIPNDVEDWSDDQLDDASLIAKGVTNQDGVFTRDVEVFSSSDSLLLVLNTVGIENKHVVTITGDFLEFTFQ